MIYSRQYCKLRPFCHRSSSVSRNNPYYTLIWLYIDAVACSVKVGYPPRSLYLVPELPVSSLDLKSGDQIIVVSSGPASPPSAAPPAPSFQPPVSTKAPISNPPSQSSNALQRQPSIPASGPAVSSGPEMVDTPSGSLVHREVPDDNSCLFSSIGIVFEQSMEVAPNLRKCEPPISSFSLRVLVKFAHVLLLIFYVSLVIAETIKNNPEDYTDAVLGCVLQNCCLLLLGWFTSFFKRIAGKVYDSNSETANLGRCYW